MPPGYLMPSAGRGHPRLLARSSLLALLAGSLAQLGSFPALLAHGPELAGLGL